MKTFMGYPVVEPEYKDVDYYLIYTGPTDEDLIHGKKYHCRAEEYVHGKLESYSVYDETGDYYLYEIDCFKKA